jgi:HK97 family phage prohead protease
MTETVTEQPVRVVAVRRLETAIAVGDGRTVSLRIAPFREHAVSADGLGGLPKGQPYKEELMPGLYDRQLKAANRVLLNFEHQQGIAGIVGHGVALRMEDDGYHGDFRVHETPDGDKALLLAEEGILQGASVESYWLKSIRSASGVVQRVKAHLEAVALCREGAYPSAVLTAIRSDEIAEDIILDESLLPITPDPEMIERCRQLGIKLPQRMMAHPDDTDTPAETGTPENGTRQDQANANLGGDE